MITAAELRPIAEKLVTAMRPFCHRVEIAGSLRRGKSDCKDLEIVAQPRTLEQRDLFGEVRVELELSELDNCLKTLVYNDVLWPAKKNGERYKQYTIRDVYPLKLDLFIVRSPAQWGAIYTIRTGPAAFSKKLVTQRRHGGHLPGQFKQKDGALWENNDLIETPTERAYFDALGLDWIAPEARR